MHWGFLFIWIIGAWLVWALLQDNRICFGSAQLSDEAFEEMPFRGIGIMDDDQRAALVGYLLMRPVVERIELCSQVQSQGRIRFLDYADVLLGQLATGVIPAVQNGAVDLFWVSGDLHVPVSVPMKAFLVLADDCPRILGKSDRERLRQIRNRTIALVSSPSEPYSRHYQRRDAQSDDRSGPATGGRFTFPYAVSHRRPPSLSRRVC